MSYTLFKIRLYIKPHGCQILLLDLIVINGVLPKTYGSLSALRLPPPIIIGPHENSTRDESGVKTYKNQSIDGITFLL